MKTIILIILILPTILNAQSLTVSGQLEQGHVQDISHVSLNINNISLHSFNARLYNYGISYSPINIKENSVGLILTRRGLPTPVDMNINFIVNAGFNINNIRISWLHISNGFGLWHRPNHAFDAINLTINLKQ